MGSKSKPEDLKPYEDPRADLNAAATSQTNANRPNQSTPWANSSWSQGPNGEWSQQVGFNGPMAGMADSLQGQAAQSMSTPFSFGQFGAMPTGDSARDQAINGAYGQAASRLDPMWNQREDQMRTRLMNQGLDPASEAFRNEMGNMGRDRNDAYTSAMNMAIGQGTSAGNSMFQNNMASRQQSIAEALRQRGMPMEELQKMQGFLAMPGFNADGSTMQAAGMGAQLNQQNTDAFNRNMLGMQEANNNSLIGTINGIGGLVGSIGPAAGAALALSDENAKTNIVRHEAEAMPGVPYASFEYIHEPGVTHHGVIAQDLERVAPEYVSEVDGVKFVDYSFLNRGEK